MLGVEPTVVEPTVKPSYSGRGAMENEQPSGVNIAGSPPAPLDVVLLLDEVSPPDVDDVVAGVLEHAANTAATPAAITIPAQSRWLIGRSLRPAASTLNAAALDFPEVVA